MAFLKTGWCEEVFKKGVLEQTTRALAERIFSSLPIYFFRGAHEYLPTRLNTNLREGKGDILHNVIIVHTDCSFVVEFLFMHYNATLCNIAWGKKLLA